MTDYIFDVFRNGENKATVVAVKRKDALARAMHYATILRKTAPVRIVERNPKRSASVEIELSQLSD